MLEWRTRILCIPIAIWIGGIYIDAYKVATTHPQTTDFYKFYLSGLKANQSQNPYWNTPPSSKNTDPCHTENTEKTNHSRNGLWDLDNLGCLHPNLNPPIWMPVFQLLAQMPFQTAFLIWSIASLGSLWIAIALTIWCTDLWPRTISPLTIFIGLSTLSVAYYPSYVNFIGGQVGSLLCTPLITAWLLIRKNRNIAAGATLGLLASLKPFLLIFIIPLAITRRRQGLSAFVVSTCLFSGIFFLAYQGDPFCTYLKSMTEVTWTHYNWNASTAGFISRFTSHHEEYLPADPNLVRQLMTWSISIILLTCFCFSTYLLAKRDADAFPFWTAYVIALLTSPLGWIYYFPALIIPALAELRKGETQTGHISNAGPALAFIILSGTPQALSIGQSTLGPIDTLWHQSLYFYALLAALAMTRITK